MVSAILKLYLPFSLVYSLARDTGRIHALNDYLSLQQTRDVYTKNK